MNIQQFALTDQLFQLSTKRWKGLQSVTTPQVSSLISVVFVKRPPQPKYNFIWDVEKVLDYIRENLSDNSALSDKLLTHKLTIYIYCTGSVGY